MFKRLFLTGMAVLFSAGLLFAFDITASTDVTVTDITVPLTSTVYTHSFPIDTGEFTTVSYYVYSAIATADVTIQLQQSWTPPTSEGFSDAKWVIPVGKTDIVTALTTEQTWYSLATTPISLPWGRFKITGIGANQADTIVNIKVYQEKPMR